MGNGLLCCSTGLPMSLTVLLSSPWGLLTPSNDCFPFRNGIFLDKSISCGSSLTLWQISDFSSVFPASLWSHNTHSSSLSAGDAGTTGSQQPSGSELTPSPQGCLGKGQSLVEALGLCSQDFGRYFFWMLSCSSRSIQLPSANVGWWWWFQSYQKQALFLNPRKPKLK